MSAMRGKVSVITGGARGVGFGIAQEILAAGGTAVIVDLNQTDVDPAVARLGERSVGSQRRRYVSSSAAGSRK